MPMGYGLWDFEQNLAVTELVIDKSYGLWQSMGYLRYGICQIRLYGNSPNSVLSTR